MFSYYNRRNEPQLPGKDSIKANLISGSKGNNFTGELERIKTLNFC